MHATEKKGHAAADALEWEDAQRLIRRLFDDRRYRDALMVSCGCFMGLRISDMLPLRWKDLESEGRIVITEKKTAKQRTMKVNSQLAEIAHACRVNMGNPADDEPVFCGQIYGTTRPLTRQRADQILKECRRRYGIPKTGVFSTHSLRKTFGRRVWMNECRKGNGDVALQLLSEVFGHSSIHITKRYLGIRQDEILSVYDQL